MTALASPPASTAPTFDGARFVGISANLMPDEVLLARRLRELKRRLAIGLAGVLVLVLAVYAFSWFQTERSHSDLSNEDGRQHTQTKTMLVYQPLIDAQSEATGITKTVGTLMSSDLQWPTLFARLRKVAPAGTSLTAVTGSVTTATASGPQSSGADSGLATLNQTGLQAVGTITITGTAKDKNSVAAFADKLVGIPGLAAPLVTSVTGAKGSITFSVNALITTDALGGRFAPAKTTPATPNGGK